MSSYKTIITRSDSIYRDKGSRFIGIALHFPNSNSLKTVIERIESEFPKATHYCYAYRVGINNDNFRVNDDGEPKGSAGAPILNQIDSFGLTNVIIIVVRYYGGTKLGVSGLINAYKHAAKETLDQAVIVEKTIKTGFTLECSYEDVHELMKYISINNLELAEKEFGMQCILRVYVEDDKLELIRKIPQSLHQLDIKIKEIEQI